MRLIAFSMTTPQILDRTKTVTRRTGWQTLPVGALVGAVEKGQGLKKGEEVNRLGILRIVDVRVERLRALTEDLAYGREEVIREGFPGLTPAEFVAMFCQGHRFLIPAVRHATGTRVMHRTRPCTPDDLVTRIAFTYAD